MRLNKGKNLKILTFFSHENQVVDLKIERLKDWDSKKSKAEPLKYFLQYEAKAIESTVLPACEII